MSDVRHDLGDDRPAAQNTDAQRSRAPLAMKIDDLLLGSRPSRPTDSATRYLAEHLAEAVLAAGANPDRALDNELSMLVDVASYLSTSHPGSRRALARAEQELAHRRGQSDLGLELGTEAPRSGRRKRTPANTGAD